jgi:hypothetical protein
MFMTEDKLTEWLGPAPSPEEAEYLEQQNKRHIEIKELFEDWFYELEGFGFRAEYFWLRISYEMGYNEGQRLYGGTE